MPGQSFYADTKYPPSYNVDDLLVFRAFATAAVSATTSTSAIAFKPDKACDYKIVVQTGAVTGTIDGSNNWEISIQSDTSAAFGSPTTLESFRVPASAQIREVAFTKRLAELLDPGATHLRVTATKTGTIGNLTFGAHLEPL